MLICYDFYINHIEKLCKQYNMSIEELAVVLGYPKNEFKRRANGTAVMKFSELNRLCYYFNIQPNDLFN